jgi:hypothetical protein
MKDGILSFLGYYETLENNLILYDQLPFAASNLDIAATAKQEIIQPILAAPTYYLLNGLEELPDQ